MKQLIKYCCSIIILFFGVNLFSFTQTTPIVLNGNEGEVIILDTAMSWKVDKSKNLAIDSLLLYEYKPFPDSTFPLTIENDYWYYFRLENNHATASAKKVLFSSERYQWIDLYTFHAGSLKQHRKGGIWSNYRDRAYPENPVCLPIIVAPCQSLEIFIKVSVFYATPHTPSMFSLQKWDFPAKNRFEFLKSKTSTIILFITLISILGIISLFALFQFYFNKDKAYLYYAGYCLGLLIFYFRTFEKAFSIPIFFIHYLDYYKEIEIYLSYFIYLNYVLFIQHFLPIKELQPTLNKGLEISKILFLLLLFLTPFIQFYGSIELMSKTKEYAAIIFFVLTLYFIFVFLFIEKNRLAKYIILGSSFLVTPALYVTVTNLIPGISDSIFFDYIDSYQTSWFTMYMYDMKIGIILEVICFLLGLSYRAKWMNEQVASQQQQIKKITFQKPENDQVEDEFILQLFIILEKNLNNTNFGTEELAKQLNISRSNLYRKLKTKTQKAPSDYIRQYRLQKAKDLLLSSEFSIAEIAYKTGFKEATHFSNAFKKLYKITPSELRFATIISDFET